MLTATRRLKRSSDYSPKTGQTLAAILFSGKYNGTNVNDADCRSYACMANLLAADRFLRFAMQA